MSGILSKRISSGAPLPDLPRHLRSAIDSLARGEPILIFDDPSRERETDIVLLSTHVNPGMVRLMREEAGGLLCVTVPNQCMKDLGLSFQHDILRTASSQFPVISRLLPDSMPYDTKSAFGLWVNHRRTYTGVSDKDRALTISEIGKLVDDMGSLEPLEARERFVRDFMVPGHVPLLHPAQGLLDERSGHTELATAMSLMGNMTPSLALIEMLGDDGGSLSRDKAERVASARGWAYVDGREIKQAWFKWSV